MPDCTSAEEQAARTIARSYKVYRLRKTVGFLRKQAAWLFTWVEPERENIDEIQRKVQDAKLQKRLCDFMELLGSDKTSSLCHSKMILMAFMLTKYPELVEDVGGEPPRDDVLPIPMVEDRELINLARLFGTFFVLVCEEPTNWMARLKFAVAYSDFCRQFLIWKAHDAGAMIRASLKIFGNILQKYNVLRQGIKSGEIDAGRNRQLMKMLRNQCEYHYMVILKIVGSNKKCKQLVCCHMLKQSFLQELTRTMGGASQLTATEWAEEDDVNSATRLRMGLMMKKVGLELRSPRYGSRMVEHDGEILGLWHGKYHEREKEVVATLLRECKNGPNGISQRQVMWIPMFIDYLLDIFKLITAAQRKELHEEYNSLDMEFALQECEMNCFNLRKLVDWMVCVIRRLSLAQKGVREPTVEQVYSCLKKENYRDAVLGLVKIVENLRMDYCDIQICRIVNTIEEGERKSKEQTAEAANDRKSTSNELILFIRDLYCDKTHICKLSQWQKPVPIDSEALNVPKVDRYFHMYYNYVDFLLGSDHFAKLPETMSMLRIPIFHLISLIYDVGRAFAIVQFTVGISGDNDYVCRLKSEVLRLLRLPGMVKRQVELLDMIMAVVAKERPGLTLAERALLKGLIGKALNNDDEVIKLARWRMKQAMLAAYNADKVVSSVRLENFDCEVKEMVELASTIWKVSFETYEPIYASIVNMKGSAKSDDMEMED